MPHVYLNEDPERCVCLGTGEFWAVGEPGQSLILNVFVPYRRPDGSLVDPGFPGLVSMLVPCKYHHTPGLTFADCEMLDGVGVLLPSGTLPEE